MPALALDPAEREAAVSLLRDLIRLDTSNPPGYEAPAIALMEERCRALGLETQVVGAHPERPNLVAAWRSRPERRRARPLLLSCHLDCVPADPDRWTHSPWSAHHDGENIWGRGAIDMKGFAAMAFAALARLRREGAEPDRDLLFVAVSDEEAGTRLGSRWLVDERPDLLGQPEYVLNEVGGFTIHRDGHRFYPVQVAEKGVAWLRLTVAGRPGHSSLPVHEHAVARLGRAIDALSRARLPWHPSDEARRFLAGFAKPRGPLAERIAGLLAHPRLGPLLLPRLVRDPSRRASVEAVLRNTANATSLLAGGSINVLPGTASVEIDGRLAPGQTAADLLREIDAVLRPHLGADYELALLRESPPVSFSAETPLYRAIERSLREADPEAHVIPSIVPGFTDSLNYARLGAQCYGFYPLRLPESLDFAALFHGDDERIPVDGFLWGIEVLAGLLHDFLGGRGE
jgi:acetylornithine deacetylase/succinyl-diaminopimelate desuccinylase-like protein